MDFTKSIRLSQEVFLKLSDRRTKAIAQNDGRNVTFDEIIGGLLDG